MLFTQRVPLSKQFETKLCLKSSCRARFLVLPTRSKVFSVRCLHRGAEPRFKNDPSNAVPDCRRPRVRCHCHFERHGEEDSAVELSDLEGKEGLAVGCTPTAAGTTTAIIISSSYNFCLHYSFSLLTYSYQ